MARTLAQEWGGGSSGFLYEKCYIFARKTPRQKFSFSQPGVFQVLLFLGAFVWRVLGEELRSCVGVLL